MWVIDHQMDTGLDYLRSLSVLSSDGSKEMKNVFYNILQKNLNKLFGQPNRKGQKLVRVLWV